MSPFQISPAAQAIGVDKPFKISRRGFLGTITGALVLGFTVPIANRPALAQAAAAVTPGTRVPAFIEIRPDSTVFFRSAFIEGGQGIFTAMAQIVGEELDVDPVNFVVEGAPPGPDYGLIGGIRFTGASFSVRSSYDLMRKLGATARCMLLKAAADRLSVPVAELSTEPGRVVHVASGRKFAYGEIAEAAAGLPVPETVLLRDPKDFRWIGKPVERLDVRAKSTGKVQYAIDTKVDGMLFAAVQHSPRLGQEPAAIENEAEIKARTGVHSVHSLPGAVAVVADSWWRARTAVEALQVSWTEAAHGTPRAMAADFSSSDHMEKLKATTGDGATFEEEGDAVAALSTATKVVEAIYNAPYLAHGQLEPPSAVARWNDDGTLELWIPNQAPEMFQADAAKVAGITPEKVIIHSPMLGGFFGRHFLYQSANPFPQAILLSKAVGRPIKLVWSREEEFLRDTLRPMAAVRFRAGLDQEGNPTAFSAVVSGEGATGRWFGRQPDKIDSSAVEGIAGKVYAIPNKRIAHIHVDDPAIIGFWRSVGHSMNDFFSETFFDEMADAGAKDPYELRLELVKHSPRHLTLLQAVANLSGGWKRGPFAANDGTRRARGLAMASPFGSEVATIAEVSLSDGQVLVHDVWVAIDPGTVVNPRVIEHQVNSAVALGVSSALLEEVVYVDGLPQARNYDSYQILTPDRMPRVHVRIIESGAPIGGIGEPGLPGVPPAIANAVAVLATERPRSLPLLKTTFQEKQ